MWRVVGWPNLLTVSFDLWRITACSKDSNLLSSPALSSGSCVGGSGSPLRLHALKTDDESTVTLTVNLLKASHLLCGRDSPALQIVSRRQAGSTSLPSRQLGVQFKGPFRELSPMRRTHNWHPSCLIKVQSAGMDPLSQVSAPIAWKSEDKQEHTKTLDGRSFNQKIDYLMMTPACVPEHIFWMLQNGTLFSLLVRLTLWFTRCLEPY